MGKSNKYVVDKCRMSGGSDTVKGLYLDGEAMQAYLGGELVFNRALYSIEAFDALVPAEGTADMKFSCLVDSIKTDYDGTQSVVDYTITPETLEANDTDKEKKGFFTVKQNVSGLEVTAQYTQDAKVLMGYTYMNLKVTSVIYMHAPAEGGYITPLVAYSGTRRAVYSNGDTVDEAWTGSADVLLSATGKALVTGATFDSVGDSIGRVYAPDLGTTESESRAVAQITALTIKAINGQTLSWSGTAYAYQMENYKTTEYGAYSVQISASATTMVSNGGKVTLSVVCKQAATYTYTSGRTNDVNLDADATLSTTCGTLSASSVTGTGSSELAIPENTGSARDITITATAADGTTKKTVTIRQDAVRYEFYSNTLAAIGAPGGDMTLNLISTRNDRPFPILKSNVVVTGITGAIVKSVETLDNGLSGEQSIVINVPSNTTTSNRDFTITATQPSSGKTFTWDAEQAGQSQIRGKVAVHLEAEYGLGKESVTYSIYFDATNATYYSGGTLSNVTINLTATQNGSGEVLASKILYGSLQVPSGTKSETSIGSLRNRNGGEVYVHVYYDNKLQYTTMPMMSPDMDLEL